ncbi:MAG TPA: acyl-ACP--UDP-N-acetylglucosamine O-acyltransferase [Candidatus Acidoferrum sp.]
MSAEPIHPQAVVSPKAKLGKGVQVGAFAVVGADVELGEACVVHDHAVVQGPSKFGAGNVFHAFCVIGGDPQDYTYAAELVQLAVGDNNIFREYVTISRGTKKGGGTTRIGSDNFFLAYSHVGHDCQVGSGTLFVNGATLAGHVTVQDHVSIGAFSPVHQFCRLGRYAYIGACTVITQDVPPFSLIVTERETRCYGANTIGLERKGFSPERVKALQKAFRLLTRSRKNTSQAIDELRTTMAESEDVKELIGFVEKAERGIVK